MASESTSRAGICHDMYGDQIEIAADGDCVLVSFWDDGMAHCLVMRLDAPQREQFQRLFMEAERQAEAWAAEHPQEAS